MDVDDVDFDDEERFFFLSGCMFSRVANLGLHDSCTGRANAGVIVVVVEESIYDRKHEDFQREEVERQRMLAQLEFEKTTWGKIVKWFRERLNWLRSKLLGDMGGSKKLDTTNEAAEKLQSTDSK